MVVAEQPIERVCYWLARRGAAARGPALEGVRRADVVIVGAGFTGLWTAQWLRALDPTLDVVVVEAESAAYGASGRNAGMVLETIDHGHGAARAHFGDEEARRLALLGRENVEELFAGIAARGIDCDLERTGRLTAALVPGHLHDLDALVEDARAVGVEDLVRLDGEAMRARVRSDRYLGAVLSPGGAVLDPVALAEGLLHDARARGITVYEGSRCTGIDAGGARARVRTARGAVVADKVVLATSAYSHQLLPELGARFLPLYDYVLVSEPLGPAQREIIGWAGREGVDDCRAFFNYYRLTKDDRILWGSSDAAYHGGRVDPGCDHSEARYAALRASFAEHFPGLADLAFPYAWGGPIDATTRFTPFFGSVSGGRVLYGLGFTGHGIATTHLAGKILAHMALGRPTELLDLSLVREPPRPYPPEPFRSLGIALVTRDLRRMDEGAKETLLLRALDLLGIGFSS